MLRISDEWRIGEEAAAPGTLYLRPVFQEHEDAITRSGGQRARFKVFSFRLDEGEFREAAAIARDGFGWTSCQLIRNLVRSFLGMVEDAGARVSIDKKPLHAAFPSALTKLAGKEVRPTRDPHSVSRSNKSRNRVSFRPACLDPALLTQLSPESDA